MSATHSSFLAIAAVASVGLIPVTCRADVLTAAPAPLTLSLSDGLLAAARQPEAPKPAQPSAPAPSPGQPGAPTPPPGQPEAPATQPVTPPAPARIGFGHAGSTWWSVGAGYMNNFNDDQAADIYVGYSRFLADELEFNLELTGWYFDQTGDNTGGINPVLNFRWHFWHDSAYSWSVYGEAGIGLLFAFDEVPDGGTGFNFTPRLGGGFTKQLSDDGTRLMLGLRWQHISNGRIEGDERNPGRDSLMFYVGVMFPF